MKNTSIPRHKTEFAFTDEQEKHIDLIEAKLWKRILNENSLSDQDKLRVRMLAETQCYIQELNQFCVDLFNEFHREKK